MSERYEYEIDEEIKLFAIKELNENPYEVNAHIESLRRWAMSMPHLQCPTDANFLLKFLRVAKFDHVKAQKRIDNFCTVRTSERGFPHMFNVYSNDDPMVDKYLNLKLLLPLGKVDSGETIILVRFGDWNPDILSLENFLGLSFMSFDVVWLEESIQIFGIKFLLDFKEFDTKSLKALCDPRLVKTFYVTFQDSYPVRFKGQIFTNYSTIVNMFYDMALFFMSDKMKKRSIRLSHDISKVKDTIPGLEKILPKEYNGHAGSLDECAERWNEKFRKFYKDEHPFQSIHVDESKRPKDTLHFLVTHADYKSETGEIKGTFTKFENVF